jgi:hypothetical protein
MTWRREATDEHTDYHRSVEFHPVRTQLIDSSGASHTQLVTTSYMCRGQLSC